MTFKQRHRKQSLWISGRRTFQKHFRVSKQEAQKPWGKSTVVCLRTRESSLRGAEGYEIRIESYPEARWLIALLVIEKILALFWMRWEATRVLSRWLVESGCNKKYLLRRGQVRVEIKQLRGISLIEVKNHARESCWEAIGFLCILMAESTGFPDRLDTSMGERKMTIVIGLRNQTNV